MADTNRELNFEAHVLKLMRDASQQLQLEEGFNWSEQPLRCLGMDWYQATEFEEARNGLRRCLDSTSRLPIRGHTLIKSLFILLGELTPLILLERLKSLPESSAYLPDTNELTDRLRHHYLVELTYQKQQSPSGESDILISESEPRELPEDVKKAKERTAKRWEEELIPAAVNLVLREVGVELGQNSIKDVIEGQYHKVQDEYPLQGETIKTVEQLPIALSYAKEIMNKKISVIFYRVEPAAREHFKPDIDEVADWIKSRLLSLSISTVSSVGQKEQTVPAETVNTIKKLLGTKEE